MRTWVRVLLYALAGVVAFLVVAWLIALITLAMAEVLHVPVT